VWAISKLYLGDTYRNGVADRNAWTSFGYDLDGKISTAASTDLCLPANNASRSSVYPDGDGGIDNAYGKSVLPIVLSINSAAASRTNQDIVAGKRTNLFVLKNLGASTDYNPITVEAYLGTNLGMTPKFDGTDLWPVAPEQLVNPMDLSQGSTLTFTASYLTGNTIVIRGEGTIPVTINSSGVLNITHPTITFTLSSDHKTATNGTIAGVIDAAQFVAQFRSFAGTIDPALCSGPTIDSIASELGQAADILTDGMQDPSQTCSGISVGLGFDVVPVQLGAIGPAATQLPNPCPDAGP
jgi:hypothetical protein